MTPRPQQLSFDGQVLWDAVQRASISSQVPILCMAQGQTLTFAALSGVDLVLSWQFGLSVAADERVVFLIPPMIAKHLLAALPQTEGGVTLTLNGGEASLATRDGLGHYGLRWSFDLHRFPAPPDLGRLLALPPKLVAVDYLQLTDAVHRAVAKLGSIEWQRQFHSPNLALLVGLSQDKLLVNGGEIRDCATDEYYFDPRLLIRALECTQAKRIEVGLTQLDSERGFLSVVDRLPDHVMHCALLSIASSSPWLLPLPPRQDRRDWEGRRASWRI